MRINTQQKSKETILINMEDNNNIDAIKEETTNVVDNRLTSSVELQKNKEDMQDYRLITRASEAFDGFVARKLFNFIVSSFIINHFLI